MQKFQELAASAVGPVRTTRKNLNGRSAFGPITAHAANWPCLHIVWSFSWTLRFVQLFPSIEPYNGDNSPKALNSPSLHLGLFWYQFHANKRILTKNKCSWRSFYLKIPISYVSPGPIHSQGVVIAHKLHQYTSWVSPDFNYLILLL